MSRRFRILLSCAFALLAVVVCAAYASHVRDEAEQVRAEAIERYGGEVVSLVVANGELPRGHVVARGDVTVRDWLADLAPADAVTSLDEAVGKEVTNPVSAGSPLTSLSFREDAEAEKVPDGYVGLSVPLGERLGMPSSASSGTKLAAWEVREDGTKLLTSDLVLLSSVARSSLSGPTSVLVAVRPADVSTILSASAAGSLRIGMPADDVLAQLSEQGTTAPASVPAEGDQADPGGSPADAGEATSGGATSPDGNASAANDKDDQAGNAREAESAK